MTNAKWIAIPVLATALVLGGALSASIRAADNGAAQEFSSRKGGKGHGYAKGQAQTWRGHYAYRSRGANNPYFCPPGQAKKPGYGSAFRC